MNGYLVLPAPGIRKLRLCVPDSSEPDVLAIRGGEYPVPLEDSSPCSARQYLRLQRYWTLGATLEFGLAAAAAGYEVVIVEANPDNANWIRESFRSIGSRTV